MRDSVGLVMLAMGADPAKAGLDAAQQAVERIEQASSEGQVRRFTGNEYARDLPKGDAWAAMAWSGDVVQLQAENENVRFVQPDEGFMLWTDNMQDRKSVV